MISEEDFATIDIRDPQMAFATLETRFRKALETNLENSQSSEAYNSYIIEYMNHTIAAARFLELDILQEWSVPSRNTSDLNEKYHAFITEFDYYKVQIRLAQLRTSVAYSVGLSGADKVKMHFYVEQMKGIIDAANLTQEKRHELYDKLNKFLKAVDQNRAPWERLGDLVVGFSTVTGESLEKLEPARKWIDSIAKLMGHNKEIEDSLPQLPRPPLKKIEHKPEEAPVVTKKPAVAKRDDLDDEIPF